MDLVGHSCVTNCVNCNSVYWFDQEEDEEVSPPFGQGALGADKLIKAAWYFMGADTV